MQGGNIGSGFGVAQEGIMSEEDYPYEHKVGLKQILVLQSFIVQKGDCRYDSSKAVASVTGMQA